MIHPSIGLRIRLHSKLMTYHQILCSNRQSFLLPNYRRVLSSPNTKRFFASRLVKFPIQLCVKWTSYGHCLMLIKIPSRTNYHVYYLRIALSSSRLHFSLGLNQVTFHHSFFPGWFKKPYKSSLMEISTVSGLRFLTP